MQERKAQAQIIIVHHCAARKGGRAEGARTDRMLSGHRRVTRDDGSSSPPRTMEAQARRSGDCDCHRRADMFCDMTAGRPLVCSAGSLEALATNRKQQTIEVRPEGGPAGAGGRGRQEKLRARRRSGRVEGAASGRGRPAGLSQHLHALDQAALGSARTRRAEAARRMRERDDERGTSEGDEISSTRMTGLDANAAWIPRIRP